MAAVTAVAAQITIPLTPVPFTLQVLAVILSGLLLGVRQGALAQAVYVLVGAVGVPVFAGFAGGVGRLRRQDHRWRFSPTGPLDRLSLGVRGPHRYLRRRGYVARRDLRPLPYGSHSRGRPAVRGLRPHKSGASRSRRGRRRSCYRFFASLRARRGQTLESIALPGLTPSVDE